MHRAIFFILSMVLVFSSYPLFAQQFEIEPDSLVGVGIKDELHVFDSYITNLWNQENRILWRVYTDIPEDWTLEVCQGTFLCWPPWVESETMVLQPEANDTLLIKFRTGETDAVGTTTIYLTAEADTTIKKNFTFTLTVGENGVDDESGPSTNGHSFQFKTNYSSNGSLISIPYASFGAITMYDMQGRLTSRVWSGQLNAGDNLISPNVSPLPAGQYIMHLSVDGIGTLDRKVMYVR